MSYYDIDAILTDAEVNQPSRSLSALAIADPSIRKSLANSNLMYLISATSITTLRTHSKLVLRSASHYGSPNRLL